MPPRKAASKTDESILVPEHRREHRREREISRRGSISSRSSPADAMDPISTISLDERVEHSGRAIEMTEMSLGLDQSRIDWEQTCFVFD